AITSGIKLNPRKLYASNSATAKELLKVTTALLDSPKSVQLDNEQIISFEESFSNDQINLIRKIRGLSSELTSLGVTMYDLIAKEAVNKETRTQYSKPMELNFVEKSLKHSISTMKSQLNAAKMTMENQIAENGNLDVKIQRKQSELDRTAHRLVTLQRIRPAYLEEFEKIELNLKELYNQYTIRIKCLDALRNFITNNNSPTSVSPMQKIQDSSIPMLPEEGLTDDEDEDDDDNNSEEINFKDDQSSLQQDIFKQVSNRLKSRVDRKTNETKERSIGLNDELSISETSPESEELESVMDLENEDERMMKFKRDTVNKAELSDEDF
ncbi:unnamed protein product, partial [Diamesa tonsa]